MKKNITIEEKAIKTIEVEVPSYYNEFGVRVAITDQSVIKVWPDNSLASFTPVTNEERYNSIIAEVMKYKANIKPITKQEFEIALSNHIKCLTEQYQLSMSMQDPNLAAAPANQEAIQEQVAAEQNAQESASQDQAMEVTQESAEEGNTEG